ncbi:vegetative cell wall protein gp1-like, partial [Tropilaelaps mercedesae]
LCQSCASPVSFLCRSCAGPVLVLCQSCASPVPILCQSCVSPVPVLCQSCATPVSVLCQSCASPVPLLCHSCGSSVPVSSASSVPVLCQSCVIPVPVLCRSCASPVLVLCQSCVSPVPVLCRSCVIPVPVLCHSCAGPVLVLCQFCVSSVSVLCQSCSRLSPWLRDACLSASTPDRDVNPFIKWGTQAQVLGGAGGVGRQSRDNSGKPRGGRINMTRSPNALHDSVNGALVWSLANSETNNNMKASPVIIIYAGLDEEAELGFYLVSLLLVLLFWTRRELADADSRETQDQSFTPTQFNYTSRCFDTGAHGTPEWAGVVRRGVCGGGISCGIAPALGRVSVVLIRTSQIRASTLPPASQCRPTFDHLTASHPPANIGSYPELVVGLIWQGHLSTYWLDDHSDYFTLPKDNTKDKAG